MYKTIAILTNLLQSNHKWCALELNSKFDRRMTILALSASQVETNTNR
jgi:hypothetical protein